MHTPDYNQEIDPLDIPLAPEVAMKLSAEEELRLCRYVFNPGVNINTSWKYVELPILTGGRWTEINKPINRPCKIGGLTSLDGPKLGTKPIYPEWLAKEMEEAYSHLGVQQIMSFIGIQSDVARAVQRIILPKMANQAHELKSELSAHIVDKRLASAARQLDELQEKHSIDRLAERTKAAAVQMLTGISKNISYCEAYIGSSLHGLSEGRSGRPGKTILDDADIAIMRWLGSEIPEEYLIYRPVGNKSDGIQEAMLAGVKEAISTMPNQSMDAATLSGVVSAAVAQTLQALGLVPKQEAPKPNATIGPPTATAINTNTVRK